MWMQVFGKLPLPSGLRPIVKYISTNLVDNLNQKILHLLMYFLYWLLHNFRFLNCFEMVWNTSFKWKLRAFLIWKCAFGEVFKNFTNYKRGSMGVSVLLRGDLLHKTQDFFTGKNFHHLKVLLLNTTRYSIS